MTSSVSVSPMLRPTIADHVLAGERHLNGTWPSATPGARRGAAMVARQIMGSLPEMIGPYRPLSILGRGGMGVVYRAEHATGGEIVALKTVVALADVERA